MRHGGEGVCVCVWGGGGVLLMHNVGMSLKCVADSSTNILCIQEYLLVYITTLMLNFVVDAQTSTG